MAQNKRETQRRLLLQFVTTVTLLLSGLSAMATGTPAGTVIQNSATIDFDLGGTPITLTSNTTSITVAERIDVTVTLQSAQVQVSAGDTIRAILFRVTNIGNGTETFQLAIDSVLAGDDFDPLPSAPDAIFFDTDGSGDFNIANDLPYSPGANDPNLAADASVDIFLVNDIPGTVVNGNIGRTELTATSATGTGAPGTVFPGLGDGGVDAVVGTTGGQAADVGEYIVVDVQANFVKSQLVSDQFGGTEPIPGATITYTVTIEITSAGTATATVFRDVVPANSTYVAGSILLNAASLSDAIDADAGEFDTSGAPTIVVRLGDLTSADGVQTVEFQVTIN